MKTATVNEKQEKQEVNKAELLLQHQKGKDLTYDKTRQLRDEGFLMPVPKYRLGHRGRPKYDYALTEKGYQHLVSNVSKIRDRKVAAKSKAGQKKVAKTAKAPTIAKPDQVSEAKAA